MEQKQINPEEKGEELYDYVLRFLKGNYKYSQVKQFLMEDGMDETTAKAVIEHVLKLREQKAKKEMQAGALVLVLGIILAVAGSILPLDGSNPNFHVIFYGPILVGIVMIIRGAKNK